MFTKQFWIDAFERASKTFAQSLVSAPIAAATMAVFTAGSGAELKFIFLNAFIAAVVSIFTSIGSNKIGTVGTASVVHTPINVTLEELARVEPAPNVANPDRITGAIPPSLAGG